MSTTPANPLVVLVRFSVIPALMGRFVELVSANALESLSVEPGCQRFDVLLPEGDKAVVVLYEIYRTPGDFEGHLTRPHYKTFESQTRSMVVAKIVERLAYLSAARP